MYDESAVEVYTTASGLERYRLPAIFPQLNKHRNVSSDSVEFAVHKAVFQDLLWKAQFDHFTSVKRKKLGLEMNAKRPEVRARQKQKIADGRTELAQQELAYAYQVLAYVLRQGKKFNWDALKKYPDYPKPVPKEPDLPEPPPNPSVPREPQITDTIFAPKLDAMDRLMRSKREQKEHEARQHFETAHTQWEQLSVRMRRLYQEQALQYKQKVQALREQYRYDMQQWEQEKERYYREREKSVQILERKKTAFTSHDPHAVLDFFDMVLAFSNYPPVFPQSYELDYDAGEKQMEIDYLLPPLKGLPRLTAVTYDKETDRFFESVLAEDERDALYARLLHEIPLRTFYEIFATDSVESINAIVFRGYLYLGADAKSGGIPSCVLNIRADRGVFCAIDLNETDSLDVFEQLGGKIQSAE